MTQTGGRCFDDATDSAEASHVLSPTFKEGRHSDYGLSWQVFLKDWFNLLHEVNVRVQLSLFQRLERFDLVNIKMCMTPPVEFIVDFEDPSGNVEVFSDQLGERMYKFLLVINVDATNRSWHIRQLEDLLGS